MFRKLFDFISHIADFFRDDTEKPIFKRNTYLVIRPDGTWVVDHSRSQQPNAPNIIKKPNTPPNTYYSYAPPMPASVWSVLDDVGEVLEPPDFFPHKEKLNQKLNQCLELNVIASCIHTKTKNGTYLLQIEVPCCDDYAASYNQFKVFVKAMENQYEFKTIQQERILSKISNDTSHLVVFEYDPRKKLF